MFDVHLFVFSHSTFDVGRSMFDVHLFVFSHSTFDVGRSMFDVHLFQPLLGKNNLALIGERPSPPPR